MNKELTSRDYMGGRLEIDYPGENVEQKKFYYWLANFSTKELKWIYKEYAKLHKCYDDQCNPEDLTEVHHDWLDPDTCLIDMGSFIKNKIMIMEILRKKNDRANYYYYLKATLNKHKTRRNK